MRTHVEFRSNKFPPYQGEEEQVNPDLWGKRLVEYLEDRLNAEEIQTGEMCPEDWGWCLPLVNDTFRMWIGCGRYQKYPDGYLCFIEPSKPFVRKWLKKIDTREIVGRIADILDKILTADADINNVHWLTKDEK